MKTGEQVHLKFHPEIRGTVSAILPDGRFRVTWPREDREPRLRFWYPAEARLTIRPVATAS